jgi:sulfofructose kinase
VKTVDTTGCGDAFHGAYAWALVSGVDLEERVRIGAAAAGVLAALPAGSPRVATRAAMDAYLG